MLNAALLMKLNLRLTTRPRPIFGDRFPPPQYIRANQDAAISTCCTIARSLEKFSSRRFAKVIALGFLQRAGNARFAMKHHDMTPPFQHLLFASVPREMRVGMVSGCALDTLKLRAITVTGEVL